MKSITAIQTGLIAFCLGLSGQPLLLAQAAPKASTGMHPYYKPPTVPPAIQRLRDPKYWAEQREEFKALTNDAWAQEQWTGNDAPYAVMRSRIESAVAAGQPPVALVSQYAGQAKKEPNNALAQFSWAYAVRLATKAAPASKAMSDLLFAACVAIAETPPPHTYNYDRLRYLLWIQDGGGAPSHFLKDMSYRLLQRDPKDFPVLLGQSLIYTQNRDKADQQTGYALIQKMIKQYPGKPEVYDVLGCWYYTQYMFYHNPKNYHLAMSNYQRAIGMYPAASPRRAGLPNVMATLTQRYRQLNGG